MTRPTDTIARLGGLILMALGLMLVLGFWPRGDFSLRTEPVATATFVVQALVTAELPTLRPSDTPVVPTTARPPTLTVTPSNTPAPTYTPTASATATHIPPSLTPRPSTAVPVLLPSAAAPSAAPVPLWQGHARFGVGVPHGTITQYPVDQLGIGWYLNWGVNANPPRPGGLEFAQMVRTKHGIPRPDTETVAAIARSLPGSLWLVGNEPDRVVWQDDATAVQYARAYYEAYQAVKHADPTAQVAIAGVIQPTPLRLRYLDQVLAAYQQLYGVPMPVDVWNIHSFILREERGAWGAEIPPGLPDQRGILREVDDSDNLDIFKSQIWAFREWMRDRGEQNKPLIVSEYGIPMPPDYGFGPDRMIRFLYGTFDFFLAASDPALGYPLDGNRLVQRWCWYSLADTDYPTGNLFDPLTFQITPLGRAWRDYVAGK